MTSIINPPLEQEFHRIMAKLYGPEWAIICKTNQIADLHRLFMGGCLIMLQQVMRATDRPEPQAMIEMNKLQDQLVEFTNTMEDLDR